MKNKDLTGKIIGACYVVANDLGHGFLESVYHQALAIALEEKGLQVQSEVALQVHFHGHVVGEFVADMLVEDRVIVELKAVKALTGAHQAQVINYLNATRVDVGILVNFGRPSPEIRRCTRCEAGTEWGTIRQSR